MSINLNFQPFTESMCERLYESNADFFILKTVSDDNICWQQGRYNNYYFESSYFGIAVSLNEIKEIAL